MSTTKAAYLKTTTMIVLAALAIALVSVLWAYTPALAQSSTVTDTRNPKVIAVRPPDGATDVSIVSPNNPHAYHKVVAFFFNSFANAVFQVEQVNLPRVSLCAVMLLQPLRGL